MNELFFASGMETIALMNDSNSRMRCLKIIQRGIFVEQAICNNIGG
jgi:hypothetical protein